ncbi:MAG: nucleoside deaminase [Bacteroidia bacterium]|nr:nucleoside deaminase [Bacteroidia bacterium]
MNEMQITFMREAIRLSLQNVGSGIGGPFGAVVVKDNNIISLATNEVSSSFDPTAHAEIVAIRKACKELGSYQLTDCELYCSCEPCPMCLGAIYWARPQAVFFANTRKDAASIGFDDAFIYEEMGKGIEERQIPMVQILQREAIEAFHQWKINGDPNLH